MSSWLTFVQLCQKITAETDSYNRSQACLMSAVLTDMWTYTEEGISPPDLSRAAKKQAAYSTKPFLRVYLLKTNQPLT
jgi:hypothetical protein